MSVFPDEIALELVPNHYEGLLADSHYALSLNLGIRCINIPEMRSKEIKGHHAADHLLRHGVDAIPHFRTRERSLSDLMGLIAPLVELGMKRVLLVTGDPPKENPFEEPRLTPIEAIPAIKKSFPGLRVYVGVDPYRQSFRKEMDYCLRKIEAGADGFFSQPFFSVHLLELWLEQLRETEFWVGVSPVTTESFRKYWEGTNQVVFPPGFSISLEDNCAVERDLLEVAAKAGQKAYLMPITVVLSDYLRILFNR